MITNPEADAPTRPASPSGTTGERPSREIYAASGTRKTAFSFAFLLLLPFAASLPIMLYQRIASGLWFETIGLMTLGAGLLIVFAIVILQLIYSLRARVVLDETGMHAVLPAGSGPSPKLFYRRADVAYEAVQAVELRREIYGAPLTPVLLTGARILTKEGDKIPLGYVNEHDIDRTFPFPDIAARIAERAQIAVTDRGTVHRSAPRKLLGLHSRPEDNQPVRDEEIAVLNRRHQHLVWALLAALAMLVVAGIVVDVLEASKLFN